MIEVLEYIAEFIIIYLLLAQVKLWYYRRQRKKNPNYPFGIKEGDEL